DRPARGAGTSVAGAADKTAAAAAGTSVAGRRAADTSAAPAARVAGTRAADKRVVRVAGTWAPGSGSLEAPGTPAADSRPVAAVRSATWRRRAGSGPRGSK